MGDLEAMRALAPGRVAPIPASVAAARLELRAALTDLAAVPAEALERAWSWLPAENDADVRYGLYRCLETLDAGAAELRRLLDEGGAAAEPGGCLLRSAAMARWELESILVTLRAADLDADPGGDEWTLRRTLAHVVSTQRGYGLATAWWLAWPAGSGPLPERVPDGVLAALPPEDDAAPGDPAAIAARYGASLDDGLARMATLDDAALAQPARWAGLPVTVGFRLGRWGSHVREHGVQLEKTLVALGRPPDETARVIRLVGAAAGRFEAEVVGLGDVVLEATGAATRLGQLAATVRRTAASVLAATTAS